MWLGECKNCTVKSFEWSSRLEKRYVNTNPFTKSIHLPNRAYTQPEEPQNTLRIMFFDFSSAFGTLQPLRLSTGRDRAGCFIWGGPSLGCYESVNSVGSSISFAVVCWGGVIATCCTNKPEQAAEEGQLCSRYGTAQCWGSEREEDERKNKSHHGQPVSSLFAGLRKLRITLSHRLIQDFASKCLAAPLCHQPSDCITPEQA